jgi:chemotaxis protein CheD
MATAVPVRAAAAPAAATRLERLKSQPRRPGEASFFWYETQFRSEAVKVLPGEYFVHREDLLIMTTLGSCIAACLWDRNAGVGGMNHFMLPDGADKDAGSAGGRYGSFAMELLINEMLKQGAQRGSIEAKVFGGGQVISGMNSMNVGERNTRFVLDYLKAERIPVVSKDVLDIYPRKVCFLPASGKAMVKRLASANHEALLALERDAAQKAAPTAGGGGSVDLF